jgi:release factor glutamine methyltransferase
MRLQELKIAFKEKLSHLYEPIELNSLFTLLIEHYTGWDALQQALNKNEVLPAVAATNFEEATLALLSEKPVQYIIGEAWFMGKAYFVNKEVLIPRPETEELVEWVMEYAAIKQTPLNIIDIGTGSGCIAISIKNNIPNCKVAALDISEGALAIAKKNADNLNASINWIQEDVLKTTSLPEKYDIIISNPPYIPFKETASMQVQVKKYEPSLALFVTNEDPLIFYAAIARLGKQCLNKNGQLFFEIHYDQKKALIKLFNELGYHAEVKKDLYGKDRMLRASLM